MSNRPVHPDFPDQYFELKLGLDDDEGGAIVEVKRKEGRLVDGVYYLPGGFKTKQSDFPRMGRNEAGRRPCRTLACLEDEIPKAIERMRHDLLLEVEAQMKYYTKMNTIFTQEPAVVEDTYRHPLLTRKPQNDSPSP